MNIIEQLKLIYFDRNRCKKFGIKSGILWGYKENNSCFPLLYISKPKHISQEDFEILLDKIDININR